MKFYLTANNLRLVIGLALAGSFCQASGQGTITIGTYNGKETIPFGISAVGEAFYIGQYQQIYGGDAIASPVLINGIGFRQLNAGLLAAEYKLQVGLGTTTRSPTLPGNTFETGAETLFSGTLSAVFTPAAGDFDLFINFTKAFYFNPFEQGNLFLDVQVVSGSGDNVVFASDGLGGSMGTLWSINGSVLARPSSGLVTQFALIPEPSSLSLLGLGTLFLAARRFRRSSCKSDSARHHHQSSKLCIKYSSSFSEL